MPEIKVKKPESILLLEDCEEDIFLFTYAMKKLNINTPIIVKNNTEEALEYLNDMNHEKPKLVLFDINLPGSSGEDFLVEARLNQSLKTIPFIAFSSSPNPQNINFCYLHGANSYLVKPTDFEQYMETIKSLFHYWYETAYTP